jgi:hypothetical protein
MIRRLTAFSLSALVVSIWTNAAVAATTLPANIQADRAAVQQDNTNLEAALTQLRTDERAHNTGALAADRTAVSLARIQREIDFGKLAQDAASILQTDETTLLSALTKLHTDQLSGGSVSADQTAVQEADTQLKNDRDAIFGDLGPGGMGR